MSARFTPGPWQVHSDQPSYSQYIVGNVDGPLDNGQFNYTPVCDVCDGEDFDGNRALIASAPDLLAALRLCLKYVNGGTDLYPGLHHEAYTAARAAIAKATGSAA